VAALHRENNAEITIFVQCFGPSPDQDDRPVARRVAERLSAVGVPVILRDDFVDPCSLQQAYSLMDAVIATRMHTAILALAAMTPAVAISYQPKARGMMTDFGLQDYQLDIDEVDAERLQQLVQSILRENEVLRAGIQRQLVVVREQLTSWVDLLDG
jgi:colanic acid/amylovoran biosynthesis protein